MTKQLLAVCLLAAASVSASASEPRTIRWVLAHTRGERNYAKLLEDFSARLEKSSRGQLKVSFIDNKSNEDQQNIAAHKQVLDGAADVGQFEQMVAKYVPAVVAPFAFRGYEHAEAVFEGPAGKKLLDGLYAQSDRKLRALAFTYSGGQRVVFGKAPLTSAEAFKGARMVTPGADGWSDLTGELFTAMGMALEPMKARGDTGDYVEDVINRGAQSLAQHPKEAKKVPFVTRTNHSMLVTAIVANQAFLDSLTKAQRETLASEIRRLAADERKLSIRLEKENVAALAKLGVKVVDMPEAERRKLADASEAVLAKHPDVYAAVREIRAVKDAAPATSSAR